MEDSVLDHIAQGIQTSVLFNGWSNGKAGTISDFKGEYVFRFREAWVDDNGNYHWANLNDAEYPIVAVGIVAYWLRHRTCNNRLSLFFAPNLPELDVKEQFDNYTKLLFEQFRKENKDNPDTWNWNWDYEFYVHHIIPYGMKQNKRTEALFDYITDEDIKVVRSVMRNYIEYLKMCRSKLGYNVSNEMKVLRSMETRDDYFLEDIDNIDLINILDTLEERGFIKVAWCEGHSSYDDVRILSKGRAYLKQLEEDVKNGTSNHNPSQGVVPISPWDDSLDSVFDSRINSQRVFLVLKDEDRPVFKSPYSRFFVFFRVLEYMHWVKGTQEDFLKWVNLHWKCGWNKKSHFKFANYIQKELRNAPLCDWYAHIIQDRDMGLAYRSLAERLFSLFADTTYDEEWRWLQDKACFYKDGVTDFINRGDLKHPFPSTV